MNTEPPAPDPAAEGAPRWVKVFAAVGLLVVLLFVVLLVVGGGHVPSRHAVAADVVALG